MEIAALGYRVDSDGALVASRNLDTMTASAGKAETQAKSLEAASRRTSTAARRVGTAAVGSSNGLRMAALQLSQVAQQGAATGNYMQALAIQLPDLALGFGTIGIAAGVAAGALLPVVANMVSASGATTSMDDAVESLNNAVEAIQQPLEILNMTLDETAAKYGDAAASVREYAQVEAELTASQARRALEERINLLGDVLDMYTTTSDAGRDYLNTINRITEDFGVSREAARELEEAFGDLSEAASFEDTIDQLNDLVAVTEMYQIALEDLPAPIQDALVLLIQLNRATEQTATSARNAAAAYREMTEGTPLFLQGLSGEELLPPQQIPDEPRTRRSGGRSGTRGLTEEQKELNAAMQEYQMILRRTETAAERYAAAEEAIMTLYEAGEITIAEREDALERLSRAYDEVPEAMRDIRSSSEDAFASMLVDIRNAEDAVNSFIGALADMAAQYAASTIFDAFVPAGGDGIFSGIGQGIQNGVAGFVGSIFGRAEGGPIEAGVPYLVNENTPNSEIIVPSHSGAVLNVAQAQAALRPAAPKIELHVHQPAGAARPSVSQSGGRVDVALGNMVAGTLAGPEVRSVMESIYGIKPVTYGG